MPNLTGYEDGDVVSVYLVCGWLLKKQSISTVDIAGGTTDKPFEQALKEAVESINKANGNTDLLVDGLTIESEAGATLGIQDFEVIDNAVVTLSSFTDFAGEDRVSFTLNGTYIEVDLTDVDSSNPSTSEAVALVFYNTITEALDGDESFTVKISSDEVTICSTDGSDIMLGDATAYSTTNPSFDC